MLPLKPSLHFFWGYSLPGTAICIILGRAQKDVPLKIFVYSPTSGYAIFEATHSISLLTALYFALLSNIASTIFFSPIYSINMFLSSICWPNVCSASSLISSQITMNRKKVGQKIISFPKISSYSCLYRRNKSFSTTTAYFPLQLFC